MTHPYRDRDREKERRRLIKKKKKLEILTKNCSNPVTSSFWDIRGIPQAIKQYHRNKVARLQAQAGMLKLQCGCKEEP